MMGSSVESRGEKALSALTELARESTQPPTSKQLDRGLQALFVRIGDPRARRITLLRWSLAGAAATACMAIAVGLLVRAGPLADKNTEPSLTYRIEGGNLVEGGYLREAGRDGIKLAFSEGSEFVLQSGTRGRLQSVDSSGARIAIESGTASFHINPRRSNARWLVDVGPFLVTVKGTVFTVAWDTANERFDLKLLRGRVTVNGPISGGDITLKAGQRLLVDLPKAETLIAELKPGENWDTTATTPYAASAPGERPASARPTPYNAAAASTASPAPKTVGEHHWTEALARGHLDKILSEARRGGIEATLEKASSDDLFALADAARYRRRVNLARKALLAGRRRFPDSPRSLDAAFLLGRVEETSHLGLAKATRWYEEYLARAPTGTYAAEALGRKMTLMKRLQGDEQARPIAEEYLRRFPSGSYAGAARALAHAP
jgi:TolA-binding protein